jgi:hypothetical protein
MPEMAKPLAAVAAPEALIAAWNPLQHLRDLRGRFSSGGGTNTGKGNSAHDAARSARQRADEHADLAMDAYGRGDEATGDRHAAAGAVAAKNADDLARHAPDPGELAHVAAQSSRARADEHAQLALDAYERGDEATGDRHAIAADAWAKNAAVRAQQAEKRRGRRKSLAASASADEGGSMPTVTAPPTAWFADPKLSRPTGLTIDEDGRVFGHIAAWDTEHLGSEGTEAPRSSSGYRYFRTGAVLTANGEQVPVGRLTVGTGHASMDAGVTAAAEHYDNTGSAVADVSVGEDAHGIWCAGVIRPGATPEQVHALRASPLSGDWRSIDGQLELVGALAVNVPGFPVPRLVADAGVPRALVAAGAVTTTEEGEVKVTFTDDQLAALRRKLGVNDDATGEAILAAVGEKAALVAAAETKATEVEAEKAALVASAKLPDGTEIVESASLAELRAAAELGRAAHARQATDDRVALVASAVKDGRVAPARREHWLKQLEADPGAEAVLASLAPGLIPVAEIGHAGDGGDPEADALYASIFGKDGA